MKKNIIILGGGYAGVLTAKHLAKKVKKLKASGTELTITLIDKNPFHTMLTELHEVAADRVDEESIKMDLKKIFAGKNVNIVLDHITNIDFKNKSLKGTNKTYAYDYLVIGSGSQQAFFGIEGAETNSFPLWSFDDAIRLKQQVLASFRAAERETDKAKRQELLTFFVVGGGFTGVEMAGELAEWIPELTKQYHIDREDIHIYNVDMMDRILTSLPAKLSAKAEKRLRKMGVTGMLNAKVTKVDKNSISIETAGNIKTYPCATVIWTAGIQGSEILANSEIEKTRGARVETNEYLQSKQYPNVYIVGDNMYYIPNGEKDPVPQMVENCEASAKTAAENLIINCTGKGSQKAYQPKFHGMMVCIGGRYGVAYVGTANKKFALPSFLAMFSKHFINIIYFIQVLGWNKVYNYLLHEVLRVRHNRSFVGGHFANYSPNFWLVPLRLFLGFSWLMEGLDKLPKIIANPTNIFLFSIPNADGITAATADAATSASEAAAAYGEALPVPGFISDIVNWSMGVFIAPIAPFFQAFMVCAEIVIGLCLLAGLFTAVASTVSCMLSMMIYASGMASESILWYLVAAIALIGIGGTGHVFALDYYVLPWLKKKWKNFKLVKKWYIYND